MPYNPDIHHRRSIRMNEYDYSQKGLYFVTICVQNYECLFGDIVEGEMQLTAVGTIADVLWYEIKNHVSSVELHEFVVMPNHIHGIIEITDNVVTAVDAANVVNIVNVNVGARHALPLQPPILTKQQPPQQSRFQNQGKNTLSPIVGSYKSAVTKHAHRLGFDAFSWQRNYHERIIRDVNDYTRIVQYIINNPQKWNNDKYYK